MATTRPLCRDYGQDDRSQRLATRIVARQRSISEQEAAMIVDIAAYDGKESWRGDGCLSMENWLVTMCHIGPARARTLVSAAQTLDEHPRLHDTLSTGDITLDVLAPLLPVATADNDASLAADSVHWTPKKARECAADLRGQRNADAVRQFKARCVRFNDDNCSLYAQFTKDGYATVKSALVGRARVTSHLSAGDPDYESFENRCADGLVQICTEAGKRVGGGGGGGGATRASAPPSRGSAPRRSGRSSGPPPEGSFGGTATTMVVHADLDYLLKGDGYGTGSIEGVGPISVEVARRLACNASLVLSLEAPDGTCLDQKPLRRDPTPAQRIEIRRRDNGCRFPGCPCRHVTDIHHVVWASKQGPTVLSNLLTLCVAHHSRVHELGWKLDGDANGAVRFTSPSSRTTVSMPSPAWRRNGRALK